jgi:hypothetical protein
MQVAETFTFQLPPGHDDAEERQQDAAAEHGNGKAGAKVARAQHADTQGAADQRTASMRSTGKAAADGPVCEDGSCGPSLMDVARLDTCVTVVDAATFFANVESIEDLTDRWAAAGGRHCLWLRVVGWYQLVYVAAGWELSGALMS